MLLTELDSSTPIKYTVYVDMDGVLANFNGYAKNKLGFDIASGDKEIKKQFWKAVGKRVKECKKFYGDLDLLPDAKELWEYVKQYNPIILSATGHIKSAASEKREWLREHFGDDIADNAIFVKSAEDKAQYANKHSILIDDRSQAIDPWKAAGGIGIHHTSAKDSISQLKDTI
jgi:5'(3')-deoxyribonucleotidase